jgi:hypothetical protein
VRTEMERKRRRVPLPASEFKIEERKEGERK